MDGETVTFDPLAATNLSALTETVTPGADAPPVAIERNPADALNLITSSPFDIIAGAEPPKPALDTSLLDPDDPLVAELAALQAPPVEEQPAEDGPVSIDPAALKRALAGDAEALAALPETVRAALTPEPVEAEPAPLVSQSDREAFGRWDELIDLSFSNPTYFAQVIAGNPQYSGFIAQMQQLAATYGLPANATGAQLEAAVLHDRVRRIQADASAARKQTQPRSADQVLADLKTEPDANLLTPEDWQAVAEKAASKSDLAVAREYERRLVLRQAQQRAKPALNVAQKTAAAAQAAQAAGERVMPTASGGLPATDYDELRQRMAAQYEAGAVDPATFQQWQAARASRASGAGSFIPGLL